jgi:hypothetical protein
MHVKVCILSDDCEWYWGTCSMRISSRDEILLKALTACTVFAVTTGAEGKPEEERSSSTGEFCVASGLAVSSVLNGVDSDARDDTAPARVSIRSMLSCNTASAWAVGRVGGDRARARSWQAWHWLQEEDRTMGDCPGRARQRRRRCKMLSRRCHVSLYARGQRGGGRRRRRRRR